jgi:hypothetical protein
MVSSVVCGNCGKVYPNHANHYGKVCMHCWTIIPPDNKIPLVMENERKLKKAQALIRRKFDELIRSGNKPM